MLSLTSTHLGRCCSVVLFTKTVLTALGFGCPLWTVLRYVSMSPNCRDLLSVVLLQIRKPAGSFFLKPFPALYSAEICDGLSALAYSLYRVDLLMVGYQICSATLVSTQFCRLGNRPLQLELAALDLRDGNWAILPFPASGRCSSLPATGACSAPGLNGL